MAARSAAAAAWSAPTLAGPAQVGSISAGRKEKVVEGGGECHRKGRNKSCAHSPQALAASRPRPSLPDSGFAVALVCRLIPSSPAASLLPSPSSRRLPPCPVSNATVSLYPGPVSLYPAPSPRHPVFPSSRIPLPACAHALLLRGPSAWPLLCAMS